LLNPCAGRFTDLDWFKILLNFRSQMTSEYIKFRGYSNHGYNKHFLADPREFVITEFDCSLILGSSQFFAVAPAALKSDT